MTTKPKLDTLAILSAMNQAQAQQFMAATSLVIGSVMLKCGLKELTIAPEDVEAIATAGRFSITANPNGGFTYKFVDEPTEAEPTEAEPAKNHRTKSRTTQDGAKHPKSTRKMP